jgi:hypothetical protein
VTVCRNDPHNAPAVTKVAPRLAAPYPEAHAAKVTTDKRYVTMMGT